MRVKQIRKEVFKTMSRVLSLRDEDRRRVENQEERICTYVTVTTELN